MTPPLQPVHSDDTLLPLKLADYARHATEELIDSLRPGNQHSLKTRPDGTILDGHHRVRILRDRGINVDDLPREVIEKED
jgi:ParB-like chromosome segregation protein Spo0J